MTERERMDAGLLYEPQDEAIMAEQTACMEKLYDFNATHPSDQIGRTEMLRGMFAEIGEGCYIEPPLRANWGGKHIHLGNYIYINFNFTAVDDGEIYIGNHVMLGPNVTIATAGHPVYPPLRERGIQYNLSVRIGDNVWVGAGVVMVPGVTIGENAVIGAGSVVTKDIPANVVAVGNPCRVMRPIGEHDREYYYKDRKIDIE